MCVLLAGEARITDADGASQPGGVGDAFVISCGLRGPWETVEPVPTFYATHRPATT